MWTRYLSEVERPFFLFPSEYNRVTAAAVSASAAAIVSLGYLHYLRIRCGAPRQWILAFMPNGHTVASIIHYLLILAYCPCIIRVPRQYIFIISIVIIMLTLLL